MKALLDTHTFLWWNLDAPQLSPTVRDIIADGENQIYLSAVCAWEIVLKHGKGRLQLPEPPRLYISDRMAHYGFLGMPIQLSHAVHVASLPGIHSDPFDRLLVAQSTLEGIHILSADPKIAEYPVSVIW